MGVHRDSVRGPNIGGVSPCHTAIDAVVYHAMCRSMLDIQSVATEIRRGKKKIEEEDRKKLQGKNIMAPYYIGRPYKTVQNLSESVIIILTIKKKT